MNIQNCHSHKHFHVRCHINRVQDFHLMLYLNSPFLLVKYWKNTYLYIFKPPSLSSTRQVMMNETVHYFHDQCLYCFYRTKALSWVTADYLQQAIYVKTKNRVYRCTKKTLTQNFPGLIIPHQVHEKVYLLNFSMYSNCDCNWTRTQSHLVSK